MAIKDSIVNLKKGLRTTLTNVPALIDTLVRGLDGVAEATEEENTYSTDERVVGKWIDGSAVYEKIINFGALPNEDTKQVAIGTENIDKIIYITGVAIGETWTLSLSFANPTGTVNAIALRASKTNVSIITKADYSTYNGYITIRYTKSAASRSPEENDTKNDGDEEKNER